MGKVYLLTLDMFDGEDNTSFAECYKDEETAKKHFDIVCEDYMPFWETFTTIKRSDSYLIAYDDLTHINICIDAKEIKEK